MKNKINIAELLKDCPKGMELDCTMYDNCTFEGIEDVGYINILLNTPSGIVQLTKEGCFVRHDDYAKCVIFPKGKTSWEGFQRPFKDGEILSNGICICLYNGNENDQYYGCYVGVGHIDYPNYFISQSQNSYFTKKNSRLATEEEKQKLFKAIKDNGYRWDEETKTLNKLIEPKFDITTLKPFDKVLTRANDNDTWVCNLYSHRIEDYCVILNAELAQQCIPYENNKHLLGKTDNCDDFYKTWE